MPRDLPRPPGEHHGAELHDRAGCQSALAHPLAERDGVCRRVPRGRRHTGLDDPRRHGHSARDVEADQDLPRRRMGLPRHIRLGRDLRRDLWSCTHHREGGGDIPQGEGCGNREDDRRRPAAPPCRRLWREDGRGRHRSRPVVSDPSPESQYKLGQHQSQHDHQGEEDQGDSTCKSAGLGHGAYDHRHHDSADGCHGDAGAGGDRG